MRYDLRKPNNTTGRPGRGGEGKQTTARSWREKYTATDGIGQAFKRNRPWDSQNRAPMERLQQYSISDPGIVRYTVRHNVHAWLSKCPPRIDPAITNNISQPVKNSLDNTCRSTFNSECGISSILLASPWRCTVKGRLIIDARNG